MGWLDRAVFGLKIVVDPRNRDSCKFMQLNLIDTVLLHYGVQ
jgi:hypothetical protein